MIAEVLHHVEALFYKLRIRQRLQNVPVKQSSAHRRACAVEHGKQRSLFCAVELVFYQFKTGDGRFVEHHKFGRYDPLRIF